MTYGRRIALWSRVAAALAAIDAALALPRLVDPDRLKRIAREKAQELWGRELSIGEVSLELWPVPTLHAGQVALANANWSKSKQLLYAESVDARLELLPLVVGKVRLKGLDLDGVRVSLETRADGVKSWDLVAPGAKKPPKAGGLDDSDFMNLMSLGIRNGDLTQRSKSGRVTLFHVDEANATADSGLRDVQFEASVTRSVETARLDWPNALTELGYPPLAPLPPEELFHDNEIAWPLLVGLDGTEGALDLKLGSFVLRNGIEMKNVKARAAWNGDKLNVSPFAVEVLGGTATGSLALEGRKKSVRVNFEGTNLLLERWFRERGSKIPFTGGSPQVEA